MSTQSQVHSASWRISLWYVLLVLCLAVFIVRLFYVQVIKHDDYQKAASSIQFKEREIAAERGVIEAYNGEQIVPLVLNERKYTLFADPKFITKPDELAGKLQALIGGETKDIKEKLVAESRYQILSKKLDKDTKKKIDDLNEKGIGTREEAYRTYPQGSLAAQVLGFVNDEGTGSYGIEQYLDSQLRGKPGLLKAITDAAGVPLVANKDNVVVDAVQGQRVRLTLDVGLQQKTEEILKQGLENAKSKSGSITIVDPNTGEVKAMADYPTYNPAEYYKVKQEEQSVFSNSNVGAPLEVGSIMKPLTIAAALDQGVINENFSYFDSGTLQIDNATIKNVAANYGQTPLKNIILLSLNTGATTVLKQMGGGTINQQAREKWFEYLTKRYHFGEQTGIEQGYEQAGSVASPTDGFGLDIQYANMSFGQGINITTLQMAAAFSSVVNGGTYYKPHLLQEVLADDYIKRDSGERILSEQSSRVITDIMQEAVDKTNVTAARKGFKVGGKTGTAQIANPSGGYYEDKINGTYAGYIGGDKPQYVVIVRVNEPGIPGFAGSRAAAPIFSSISNMILDGFEVTPKSQ